MAITDFQTGLSLGTLRGSNPRSPFGCEIVEQWDYFPSRPPGKIYLKRALARFRRRPFPSSALLHDTDLAHSRWTVWFVFAPNGQLDPAHRFTLSKLRAMDAGLLVVCAAPEASDIPVELRSADVLVWKGLSGFDFSAYTLALSMLAHKRPGSDVLLLNDSILGPFGDTEELWADATWDLSGFTASSQFENHLQSYALRLRSVDQAKMLSLRSVFPVHHAYDDFDAVVVRQELLLARRAAQAGLSVGSRLFCKSADALDATLIFPLPLLKAGFPFLKRSLFGKHGGFADEAALRAALEELGHPADTRAWR